MKRFLTILASSFFALMCCESAAAQTIDSISELQNSRSLADGKLYRFLRSPDPSVRSRAAVALANIQDSSSIQFLLPLLKDSIPSVRRSTAFALGQIGNPQGCSYLIDRIQSEYDSTCMLQIIDAIGKCGTRENLRSLVVKAAPYSESAQSSVALAVARFAIRRIKDTTATEFVAGLIGHPGTARMAAYAMMRIADSSSVERHLRALIAAMNDSSAEVRMWTATIFGVVSDSAPSSTVMKHAIDDPDWRVRVNCIRSLRTQTMENVTPVLLSLIADGNEHVALTAFSVLNSVVEKYPSEKLLGTLQRLLADSNHYTWRQRGEAAVLIAKLSKEKCIPQLIRLLDANSMFRSNIVSALGETKSENAIPYLQDELLGDDPRSVSAAVESYQNIVSDKDSSVQAEFCRKILPLLQKRDIAISYSVAAAFEDTSIRSSVRFQNLPKFIDAYQYLTTPNDVEVMVEFINLFAGLKAEAAIPLLKRSLRDKDKIVAQAASHALQSITGKQYDAENFSASDTGKFYSPEDLVLLKRYRSALLVTSKGEIRIEFRPDAAPFTVLNFIILSRRHFYDGLIFHRVVPNFVIQGGDPLGTGFGGPGYAIRTEVHPDAVYSEGAVGMASAGKDTEGSQFFITHCPTPHLDGRYTVFGYTRDLDIVGKIQIGDVIISVKLIE